MRFLLLFSIILNSFLNFPPIFPQLKKGQYLSKTIKVLPPMNLVGGLKINQLFDEPPFAFVIEFAAAPGNVYGVADSRTAANMPGRGLPHVNNPCNIKSAPVLPLDGERRHFAVLVHAQDYGNINLFITCHTPSMRKKLRKVFGRRVQSTGLERPKATKL